jgi:hypothetical protein
MQPYDALTPGLAMDNCSSNLHLQQQPGYYAHQRFQDSPADACLRPTGNLNAQYGITATPYSTPIKSTAPWGQCFAQQQQAVAADVAALTASLAASLGPSLQCPSFLQATAGFAGLYNDVSSPFASPAVPAVPAAATTSSTTTTQYLSPWNPPSSPLVNMTYGTVYYNNTSLSGTATVPSASPVPATTAGAAATEATSTAANARQGASGYSNLPSPRDLQEFGFSGGSIPATVNSKFDWQPQAIKASLPRHLVPPSPAASSDNRYLKQQQVRQRTRAGATSQQEWCSAHACNGMLLQK